MLILLSPAKKLDFAGQPPPHPHSLPQFGEQSALLADLMRNKTPNALRKLLSISPSLAELNFQRWQNWRPPEAPGADCRQVLFAFRGDVYVELKPEELDSDDLDWAQQHLCILSGLHGLLRPLDLIRPHRLEMNARLKNPAGADLYALWKERLTATLAERLEQDETPWVLNLASNNYSQALDLDSLEAQVITPVFQIHTKAGWRPTMFRSKRARGTMAAWAIRERLNDPAQLGDFAENGFRYRPDLSENGRAIFRLEG